MSTPIQYVYIYVKKNEIDDCCKYGMKLSKHFNKSYKIKGTNKKIITGYLSPKDSSYYNNCDFDILRIKLSNIQAFILDKDCTDLICNLNDYILGTYHNPEVLITSSIMPENIFKYNRILDVPLLIQNSKEFYLSRIEEKQNEIENSKFTFNDLKNF